MLFIDRNYGIQARPVAKEQLSPVEQQQRSFSSSAGLSAAPSGRCTDNSPLSR